MMSQKNDFLVLDCTVRDGGYINRWDFAPQMVKEMYLASSAAGSDIFEIGFLSNDESLPLWRRCPSEEVHKVREDGKAMIAAMLEANTVGMKLPDPSESGIDILRIALNRDKISYALSRISDYKKQGYKIFFQLMGITGYRDIELLRTVEEIEKNGCVDFINIGDSYGSLFPQKTSKIISLIKANTKCSVGLHPHNNLQLGMANILSAISAGADVIDGSIFGMGRGGGNVPLELIISLFERDDAERFSVLPLLEFIDRHMIKLTEQYSWGYSLPSMLSGAYECHPYYTSTLVDKREYTIEQILRAVQIIHNTNVIGFDGPLLSSIAESGFARNEDELKENCKAYISKHSDKVEYAGKHAGRPFLILGNGPSLVEQRDVVKKYIEENDPIIMGANNLSNLWVPHYHGFSNQRRFEQYHSSISKESTVLLTPDISIKDFGGAYMNIKCFCSSILDVDIVNSVITSKCRSVSVLLGAVALVMGAKSICYAGMDGYSDGARLYYDEDQCKDPESEIIKHKENEKQLQQLSSLARQAGCEFFRFITTTSYDAASIEFGKN